MSVQSYQQRVETLQREIDRLNRQASDQQNREAQLQNSIIRAQNSIARTSSMTTIRSKSRQIEQWNKDLARIGTKKADIAKKLSKKSQDLTKARVKLEQAKQRHGREEARRQQDRERRLQSEVSRLGSTTEALRRELNVVYDSEAILSNVFILESDLFQGSCFMLQDVGIVTCAHVLHDKKRIFRATENSKQMPISIIAKSDVIDIAMIESEGFETGEGLPAGTSDGLKIGDRVLLAGFPNYRRGDSGIVVPGSVTGFRTVSGIQRILVSMSIVAGNSGGPVLNSQGEVIGVAITGADRMEDAGRTENHGVVPIEALKFVQ